MIKKLVRHGNSRALVIDRAILDCLVNKFSGKAVGLSTLAVAIGEEPDTVEAVVEPFLVRIGLIVRTPRGRQATPKAYQHLGVEAVATPQTTLGNL